MKKLMLLLCLAVALPFVLPWGNPLLTWEQVMQYKETIPLPAIPGLDDGDQRQVSIYRWRDTEGNWHFSSEPPTGRIDYQVIEVDPDTNLIPALPGATPPAEGEAKAQGSSVFGYSADDLNKLLQGNGETGEAMQQRQQQQETMIEKGQ